MGLRGDVVAMVRPASSNVRFLWMVRFARPNVSGHQKLPCPLTANRSVVEMNALRDESSRSDYPDARRESAPASCCVSDVTPSRVI